MNMRRTKTWSIFDYQDTSLSYEVVYFNWWSISGLEILSPHLWALLLIFVDFDPDLTAKKSETRLDHSDDARIVLV